MENKAFKEIIVNCNALETRIAVLEDHQLVEFYTEKVDKQLIVGNIYKGIVKNVLSGLGAAFVDIGLDRTAFLHYQDISGKFFPAKYKFGRNSSAIGNIIKAGQEIVVQIKKGPVGQKGARVTGSLSIPGKTLVFMPYMKKIAISRKITSAKKRNRIKSILERIKDPTVGLIVRTDASETSEEDFIQEYNGLEKTWKLIEKQMEFSKPPICIFEENDLSFTLIRDIFSSKIDRLVIDDNKLKSKVERRLNDLYPDMISRIELYNEDSPIFDAYGIEKEIGKIFHSRLYLPSGGNITIEHTEALIAIDVNTGSYIGKQNYEETIKRTNIEAGIEIARQIRLRDLSGIIVIDFIDMRDKKNRDEVFQILTKHLKRDREKNKAYPFSHLGLVEISRKRSRPSFMTVQSEQCPFCKGSGRILSRDSVVILLNRWLQRANYFLEKEHLEIRVHPNVYEYLTNKESLIENISCKIDIISDPAIHYAQFKIFSKITNKELTEKYNT